MPEWATRVAVNESLSRNVNELLAAEEDALRLTIICECARHDCAERIDVARTEYEEVREDPTMFLVLRGHADRTVEEVVRSEGDHEVVRKIGQAGAIAEELDPNG
jgi:hypothetical protein